MLQKIIAYRLLLLGPAAVTPGIKPSWGRREFRFDNDELDLDYALGRMAELGFISQAQANAALGAPVTYSAAKAASISRCSSFHSGTASGRIGTMKRLPFGRSTRPVLPGGRPLSAAASPPWSPPP